MRYFLVFIIISVFSMIKFKKNYSFFACVIIASSIGLVSTMLEEYQIIFTGMTLLSYTYKLLFIASLFIELLLCKKEGK